MSLRMVANSFSWGSLVSSNLLACFCQRPGEQRPPPSLIGRLRAPFSTSIGGPLPHHPAPRTGWPPISPHLCDIIKTSLGHVTASSPTCVLQASAHVVSPSVGVGGSMVTATSSFGLSVRGFICGMPSTISCTILNSGVPFSACTSEEQQYSSPVPFCPNTGPGHFWGSCDHSFFGQSGHT